jgi:flagella basal body P-ring formation protein FlgA
MKPLLHRIAGSLFVHLRKSLSTSLGATLGVAVLAMSAAAPAQNTPQNTQSVAAIHQAVDQFVRLQTSGLPGKINYTIGSIDPRLLLPACAALDVFIPSGARLWGQTTLGVRCGGAAPWTIYVNAEVRVSGNYLATTRAIAPGQVLTAADIVTQSGDLTLLPSGVLANPEHAVGKIAVAAVAAGQPLRYDLLRAPLAVQQGQSVKLMSSGAGFRVSAEGRALNNAQDGQVAQVRTASGQTVSGVARAGGSVEISF